MTSPLPSAPSIDYTSRDYVAVRDDLINLIPSFMPGWISRSPNDFGIVLLELWAYVADQMNYYADRVANEAYLDTAVQRESVIRIARMMGYTPASALAAQATLTFTNSTASAVVVPAMAQVSTLVDTAGVTSSQIFETDAAVTVPASGTATASAHQGTTVANEAVATSTGKVDQVYALFNSNVINGSIAVTVNDGTPRTWNYVPRLVTAGALDLSYSLIVDDQDVTYIQFGDGANGAIPAVGATITATYRIGGGVAGNVGPNAISKIVSGVPAGISVTNPAAASGGVDAETTDSIRKNAQTAASTLQRAVTLEDYAALATLVPGCGAASAVSAVNTSVTLYVAPSNGGGYAGAGGTTGAATAALTSLLSTVSTSIQKPAGTSLTVQGPTYVPVNVTVTLHIADQVRQSVTSTAATAALQSYFAFANMAFGKTVPLDDIYQTLRSVTGVNYSDITVLSKTGSGATALTFAANEFPVAGTVTVSAVGGISS
jgi:hypothetical protein